MWYFEPVWKFREKGMGKQPAGGKTPATPAPAAPAVTPAPAGSGQPKKPAAEWKTGTTHDRAYSHTWHTAPTSEHALHVWHTHGDGADDLTVDIKKPPSAEQKKLGVANHTVTLHHDRVNGEAWVVSGEPWKLPHEGEQVAEPSPELQSLIQNHHYDHAWMPLLDKLSEEYPEHFDTPVRTHTNARQGFREKSMGDQPVGHPVGGVGSQPVLPHTKSTGWSEHKEVVADGGIRTTRHVSPSKQHELRVNSIGRKDDISHKVIINNKRPPKGSVGYTSLSINHDGEGLVFHENKYHRVKPPSESLRSMVAGFHEHGAWMPLLDKLAEEYPEHFTAPVQAHTKARNHIPKPRATRIATPPAPAAPTPAQPPRPTA